MVPGRSGATRLPSPSELRATLVVRFPIAEASAKVRAGGPIDDPADLDLPHWAGVIPLAMVCGAPEADPPTARRTGGPVLVDRKGVRGPGTSGRRVGRNHGYDEDRGGDAQ